MKGFALLLIFLLQIGFPGIELLFVILSMFLPRLKMELLVEALEAGRKLDSLEDRHLRFASSCAACAKDLLLSDVELEIAACQSEILRLRSSEFDDEVHQRMLLIDEAALVQFEKQRRDILGFEVHELQTSYLSFLEDSIEEARVHFYRLARAYRSGIVENESNLAPRSMICSYCAVPVFELGNSVS